MHQRLLAGLAFLCAPAFGTAAEFEPPVRLMADGTAIRVEHPGYAYPTLVDMDGDGKKDLVVAQFNKGKMRVFKCLGGTKFAAGTWLQAEGKDAEVPGIW